MCVKHRIKIKKVKKISSYRVFEIVTRLLKSMGVKDVEASEEEVVATLDVEVSTITGDPRDPILVGRVLDASKQTRTHIYTHNLNKNKCRKYNKQKLENTIKVN